jgi:hypothetical protein
MFAILTLDHKNTKAQFSKTHLTNLHLNNFKMIGAMVLKITASSFP